MEKEAIDFIKDNLSLIDNNEFEKLYSRVPLNYRGDVTSLLLEADIDPLKYVDRIPRFYLHNQKGIKSIKIPNNIKFIEGSAFSGCQDLKSIDIPNNVMLIGNYVFYICDSLSNINIGNGVVNIGQYAFYGCSSLTNIIIPDNVEEIQSQAFGYCTSLTNITLGRGIKGINYDIFDTCRSLKSINYNGTKKQWNRISKDEEWNLSSEIEVIHCIDGDIKL